MNNQIFKYGPLRIQNHPQDWQSLTLPEYSVFRHFGIQDGSLYAWFEVNCGAIQSEIQVTIVGTGWDVPEEADYLGTCITQDGYVWHLYQRA